VKQNKLLDTTANVKSANRLQHTHLCLFQRKLPLTQSLLNYNDKSLLFQQSTTGTSVIKMSPLFLLQMKEATWMKTQYCHYKSAGTRRVCSTESV